jgi:hypothetical protein
MFFFTGFRFLEQSFNPDRHDVVIAFERWRQLIPKKWKSSTHIWQRLLNCARYKHLARTGKRCHPRADVHGNSAHVVTHHFTLACVKTGAYFDSEWLDLIGYSASATHAARRTVKSS